MPPLPLLILVPIIAFLYSSVGFGGASGYLAVMGLFQLSTSLMASTALTLNVVVAGISFTSYARAGHLEKRLLLPFLATSIPAAFLGGYFKINDTLYFLILYGVLTYIMVRMLFFPSKGDESASLRPVPLPLALLSGAAIGMLSGMVGIGGGVFLSPLIILLHWGTTKQASAAAAAFIVLNSISGLLGRLSGGNFELGTLGLVLLPLGILGAWLGSWLGARRFSGRLLQRLLGLVLLIAVSKYWLTRF